MKVIWRGEDDELGLRNGKEYEVIGISKIFDAYGIVDETGYAHLWPIDGFEISDPYPEPPLRKEEPIKIL